MKIYDRHSYTMMFILTGIYMLLGVLKGYFISIDAFSIGYFFMGFLGCIYLVITYQNPFLEIKDDVIIKAGIFKKKRMKIADVKSIEKVENKLLIKSENDQIKISKGMLDDSKLINFEIYLKSKINQ